MNILISGGTGAFGQAYVDSLLQGLTPGWPIGDTRICIYSRDEAKQAAMRARLHDHPALRWFIGDVRDKDRLTRAMRGVTTVIHAAALKRIEVGHYNPDEMVKTNVLGAMNVIDAATVAGVDKVVALSTDKAYQPVSAYGYSKALAERLFLASNDMQSTTRFAVTRYGNVAGSTGSVIPIWRAILNETDTVPITSTQCTRFWMFMDEAIDLVTATLETMPNDPAIPILPAFRVADLATAMDAKLRVIGLHPFEKTHEGMEDGNTSDTAERLTVAQLREYLTHV